MLCNSLNKNIIIVVVIKLQKTFYLNSYPENLFSILFCLCLEFSVSELYLQTICLVTLQVITWFAFFDKGVRQTRQGNLLITNNYFLTVNSASNMFHLLICQTCMYTLSSDFPSTLHVLNIYTVPFLTWKLESILVLCLEMSLLQILIVFIVSWKHSC